MSPAKSPNPIFSGILALSGEQIFKLILGLISNVIIIRFLLPEDLGVLSYILSFSVIISHFTTFGTHEPTIKFLLRDKKINDGKDHARIMGSSSATKAIGSIFGLICLGPIVLLSDSQPKIKIYIILLVLSQSFKIFDTIYEYLLTQLNLNRAALHRTLLSSFLTFLRALVVFLTSKWDYVLWLAYLEMLFLALVYISIYKSESLTLSHWKLDWTIVKKLLKESFPLFILTLSTFAIIRTDQLMISYLLSFKENGYYSVSSRIIESILFLPITISCVYYPAIIESNNRERMTEKIREMYGLLLVLALIQIIIFCTLSSFLIPLLFGENYSPATRPFLINVWSLIFIYWNLGRLKVAPSFDKKWGHIFVVLLSLFLNTGFNYFFIPLKGLQGAAYATLLAPFFATIFISFFNQNIREDAWLFLTSPFYLIRKLFKFN